MNCPICTDADLVMADRQGIEIDYCPKCRGVWLDRGELDKIIERSVPQSSPPPRERETYDDRSRGHDKSDYHHKKKKRKSPASFLGDLFEF